MDLKEKSRITPVQLKLLFITIIIFSLIIHALPYLRYSNLYGYDDQAHYAVVENVLNKGHISSIDTLITPNYVEFKLFFALESIISSILGVDPGISGLVIIEGAIIILLIFTFLFVKDFFPDNDILPILSTFFIAIAPNLLFRMTFRVPQTIGFAFFLMAMILFFRILYKPTKRLIVTFLLFSVAILLTHHLTSLILIGCLWLSLYCWEFMHSKRHKLAFIIVFLITCVTFFIFINSNVISSLFSKSMQIFDIQIQPEFFATLIIIIIVFLYYLLFHLIKKSHILISQIIKIMKFVLKSVVEKNTFFFACLLPMLLFVWFFLYLFYLNNIFIRRWFIDKIYLYIWLLLSLIGFQSGFKKNKKTAIVFASVFIILIFTLIGIFILSTILLPMRIFLFYYTLTAPFVALGCFEIFYRFNKITHRIIYKKLLSRLFTLFIILTIFYVTLFVVYSYEPTSSSRPFFYYNDELSAVTWLGKHNSDDGPIVASDGRGSYLILRGNISPNWDTFWRHQNLVSTGEIKNNTIYFITSSMLQSTNVYGSPFTDPRRGRISTININATSLNLICSSKHVRMYKSTSDEKIEPLVESTWSTGGN